MGDSTNFRRGPHSGTQDSGDADQGGPLDAEREPQRGLWQWLNPGPGGDDSAAAPVQRRSDGAAPQSADPRTIGARGTEGASTRLPYLDIIQRMFGRHDVSAVKARVGGAAAEASHALGAVAYTQGEQVAFATSPDLHTAAHEAAHVVQQRHGVAVTGGLDGGPGDPHEQHADAVADHVVRGESAEALLDQAGGGAAPNAAPVQRKASMQRVSDAAAPKPAGPEMYFTVHQTVLWRSVAAHLAQVPWPDPDPHFAWTDQPKFVAALMRSLERTVDLDKPAQLDEALYPAKATAVVHPLLPVKMETWVPAIGRAIGELFEDVILSSLTRLGPRWVAVAEHEPDPDGALDETKPLVRYDQLVKSAPIDRAVATGLTTRGVGQLVGATTTASLAKTKPHALRPVTVEWQGAKDRTLWNWVKATPSDATPEEVAAKLWQHAQGQYGEPTSFFAYGLTSVPPMFGLPPSWARGFREASEFAPTTSGDESQGARYLALAQSSLGDGLAVAQAPAATKSAAPTPKASLLVGTLADMTMQAQYLFATLSVWKQGAGAATLFQWLAAKQHQIATMEPAELGTWEPILAGQKARLTRIGTGIGQVVDAAGGMGIANADAPGAGALVDILGTYARAAALSHLHDTAEQLITRAAALQEGLAVKAVRGTANEMTAAVAGARQVIPDGPSVQLGKDASQVEDASRAIQSKLAAGEHVDESDVDEVTLRAREVTFDARTRTLLAQAQELRASAKQAGEGLASRIAARLHGSFKDLNTALATIWNDVGSIAQTREAEIAAFDREDTNPVDREQRRRTIRHERLKTAEAEFASLRANTEVMDFLKEGATIIKWQRFATACVDMLALIAVSIVASGAGALVAESIGSLMTGAGAAESVTELSAGARFVAGSARAVTEAAVNTGGQVAVQGGDVGEAFAENLLMTVGSMTVIDRLAKDLSLATKIEEQTAGLWAKVGRAGKVVLREGAAISLHTVSGAALGYVAHMVVTRKVTPLAMDLQDWFLQGASVALGRHAHDLVKARRPLHEKLELINELHAGDLAPLDGQLLRLGERAQTAPKPEDVVAILELRQHVLERELSALETLAGDEELQKRAHLGAADIRRLEGETRGALGEASGAGLDQVVLQTSGLEPLIPGRVYKGRAEHLQHLEATAKRMGLSVLAEPQPDGTYRVTLDGKPFTVHIVEGGPAAKPGELEVKAPVPPVDEHAGKPNRAGFGHAPKEIHEPAPPVESASDWVERLVAQMTPEERSQYELMRSKWKSPEEMRNAFANDFDAARQAVRNALAQKAGAQAVKDVSAKRIAEIREFVKSRGILKEREATEILAKLPEHPSKGEINEAARELRTVVVADLMAEKNTARYPGARVLREVKVWEAQPGIAVSDFRTMANDQKQGLTLREGIDGKTQVFKDMTDIDALVVTPGASGKDKILRLEQQKTGTLDSHADAKSQNDRALAVIDAALAGGKAIRLEVAGKDITGSIDLSSAATADKVTVGPAAKGFDESLDVTASDLERLMKTLVTEATKSGGST